VLTYVLRSDAALGQYLSLSSSSSICQPILVSVCPPSFHLSLMNSQVLNGNWQNRDIVNSCSSCASPPREHAHSRWRATTTMYNAAHLSQFRACSWQEFDTEIQGKKGCREVFGNFLGRRYWTDIYIRGEERHTHGANAEENVQLHTARQGSMVMSLLKQ